MIELRKFLEGDLVTLVGEEKIVQKQVLTAIFVFYKLKLQQDDIVGCSFGDEPIEEEWKMLVTQTRLVEGR